MRQSVHVDWGKLLSNVDNCSLVIKTRLQLHCTSDYNQRRFLEGFKTSQTDLNPQVRRGSLIHTLREDKDQNLKMFFFSALQALAYSVWIINKVRVQYPQASFLDLLLMDSINLLMFEENVFLLLISTFNPHEIIFWNSVHQWTEQKALLIGQQNFNLSGNVRFQWIQRSTIRCIAACSISTDLYLLNKIFFARIFRHQEVLQL